MGSEYHAKNPSSNPKSQIENFLLLKIAMLVFIAHHTIIKFVIIESILFNGKQNHN